MNVIINGVLQSAEHAAISIFDRGFLYGDGLFESVRITEGVPVFWEEHWQRLAQGAEFLQIPLPFGKAQLKAKSGELIRANQVGEAILRITLTRGKAGQGYLPTHAVSPTWILHTRPAPDWAHPPQWKLGVSSYRVAQGSALHRVKSLDKIMQVTARLEMQEEGMDEAIILNTAGEIAETTACNIFLVMGQTLTTPPDSAPALPGITRNILLEEAQRAGFKTEVRSMMLEDIDTAQGIFLTVTSYGLVEVSHIGQQEVLPPEKFSQLRELFFARVKKEVARELAALQP